MKKRAEEADVECRVAKAEADRKANEEGQCTAKEKAEAEQKAAKAEVGKKVNKEALCKEKAEAERQAAKTEADMIANAEGLRKAKENAEIEQQVAIAKADEKANEESQLKAKEKTEGKRKLPRQRYVRRQTKKHSVRLRRKPRDAQLAEVLTEELKNKTSVKQNNRICTFVKQMLNKNTRMVAASSL